MLNTSRGLAAAALLFVALTGSPGLAQETNTLGPAELRNFRLPGERTTPPAPAEQPQPKAETPAPATTPPPAPVTNNQPRSVSAQPRAAAERPAQSRPAPAAATPPPAAAEPTAPAPSLPEAAAPTQPEPLPVTVEPQQPAAAEPEGATAPTPSAGFPWIWLAVPAALALLGLIAWRRRRGDDGAAVEVQEEVPPVQPAAAPAEEERPRRQPQMSPPVAKPLVKPALKLPPKVRAVPAAPPKPVGPRAELEVEFIPARASATNDAAIVEFELVLKNVGDVPAANIRIDTRMYNATATKEMAEFLKGPIHDQSGSPHVQIAPGEALRLNSTMAMPKQDVREIMMGGKRLFVPAVASIVAWDWGSEGKKRTSLSWLVGRESENRAEKMGAFRLDLGPRIYRQVGVRPLKLVA
ncbi:MAG TPA: hypothetical protein VGB70_08340 [Allosphingosinicella sp.]|jgi:hypothetical protein